MSKKQPSRLRKVANSTVFAPVNMVFNRGTRTTGRLYSEALRANTKIYCPRCTQGVFQLITPRRDEDEENNNASSSFIWTCSHCSLEVQTQSKNQKELISVLNDNSHQWYQEGIDGGYDDFTDDQRAYGVHQYLKKAAVFYVLSLICLLFVPYFVINSTALPTINMILLLTFLTLSGLINAFRAFKLHNDLLYYPKPKVLFMTWLKSGRYFKPWDYRPTTKQKQ